MPKSTGEDWMSVPDACSYLGIVNRTLYHLIDTGRVPAYKFGRVIRLRRADVVAFLEGQRIQPGTLGYPQNERRRTVKVGVLVPHSPGAAGLLQLTYYLKHVD